MNMDVSVNTDNILKGMCHNIYLISLGDFWYEPIYRPKWKKILYTAYSHITFVILSGVICLEFLEAVLNTFPADQHRDAVSYSAAQISLFAKIIMFKRKKAQVQELLRDIVNVCKGYEYYPLLKLQRRKIRISLILQFFAIYSALAMYAVEGLRRMYFEGDIFISVITYWPKYEDRSTFALIVRILIIPIVYFMMATMIFSETLIIALLIILSLKFTTLKQYFEDIGEHYKKNCTAENISSLTKQLKENYLKGILMHRELLRLAKKIYEVFGVMMALQVGQSSAVVVMILLRLSLVETQTLLNVCMSLFFMFALYIQLALYLWNAGDVTFNAALMPDAIFHCGWYLCPLEDPSYKDIRRLAIMGIAQAQRPVVMKAFGLADMSYETFVGVARATYSIFALFH